jgi:O-antigen/teichoic acid export membrane protein
MRLAGYVIGVGASVASSALLFRHLGVVDTGHYVTIVTLVTLAAGITDAGLSAVGVRELSTLDDASARSTYANLFGIRMTLSAAGLCAALAFALLAYPATLVLGTLIAGCAILLQTAQDTFAIPLLARLRIGWVAAIDLLRQLVTAAVIVVLVVAGATLLPFWTAAVAGSAVAAAAAALLVRRAVRLAPAFQRSVWSPLLRDTLPYALAAAVGAIYYRLSILIVSLVTGGNQVGYFGASYRIIDVLIVIPQLLVGAGFPIIARAARDDSRRFDYAIGRTVDVGFILGLTAVLALLTGAPFIIEVVAGPHFGPAVPVLRIQGIGLLGSFIGAVFGYGLLGIHRYRAVLLVNLGVLSLNGVLTGLLSASDGARGAATAVAIVEVLYAALLGLALIRSGSRPHVTLSRLPRALLAAGLGALALVPGGLPSFARMLIALAVYALALAFMRALPQELTDQLPRRRRAT